ncbi:unnamed protein product [Auanema sp. JU1783]|nr:unnamed protein product [Auanema sp. JU1783]
MKGHTEHRANEWKPEEIYRSCVQAMEGRCSRRSKTIHEQKLAVKEFVAKVEVLLLNELGRHLEQINEPDRRMISRLNRALTSIELQDERPLLYHVPSPSRPAWKLWNLDQEDPNKMSDLLELAGDLLQIPREDHFPEEEFQIKDKAEWKTREAAEAIAHCLGARLVLDTSTSYSRTASPDSRRTSWEDQRRRGNSVDSLRRHLPLEPSVFIRDRPSVMSFRERSIPTDSARSFNDSFNSDQSHRSFDSKPGSVMSSIPMYPCDQSLGSGASSNSQAVTPVPTTNGDLGNKLNPPPVANEIVDRFGKKFLTRPICVQSFNTKSYPNSIAISDSCGGVYITNLQGEIQEHVLIKNSSASSIAFDEKNELMYVSVMQSKGRSIHVFDVANEFKKIEVIPSPKEPKIEISRTRWITVAPRGHLYMVSGDNMKSALWCYIRGRKGWKTLKESRKTRFQYLSVAEDQAEYRAVVLLTCDAANNRLLLFVVDHSLSLINEYDLSKTYRLQEHITSPASAIVDVQGNLIILDYATGKLWILLSGVKGVRRLKQIQLAEPIEPQEALGICTLKDNILIACFGQREIRISTYLDNGVFRGSALTPQTRAVSASAVSNGGRRSTSLPRPSESAL